MLRDPYVKGTEELKKVLESFDLQGDSLIDVQSYKMLTPDSFIWELRTAGGTYYLYAEDYIPSFAHVVSKIAEVSGQTEGQFIKCITPKADDVVSQFCINSGYDAVFLYKVGTKKANNG